MLLHQWLINNIKPCNAADVGGGKGLLAYLLDKDGWNVTVIDPEYQELPVKYTDLNKKKNKINIDEKVVRINKGFSYEMVNDYDLIIGLHAHGVNMNIIKACKEYGKSFVLFPCCVIDEPIEKKQDLNWIKSLEDYALSLDIHTEKIKLDMVGNNIGLIWIKKELRVES